MEKAGKSLCAECAKNYIGLEYPIRPGAATCANEKEKLTSNVRAKNLTELYT